MSFKNITFILHKPQLSENIGACARALKNFNFNRVVDVTNYYGLLIKNKPSKDYSQKYFYFLLNNFQFDKTWAEYQSYYKSKKSTAGLDLSKKKVYVSSGEKVGEDVKISSKPRNIIEFINK